MANRPILTSSFPVPFLCSPIRPRRIAILLVQKTKEVPFHVPAFQLRLPREVPWLDLVDVDDGDGVEAEGLPGDLALQIVPNQFFIRRVESESGSE